mgnify:CR=1 FL=1
MWHFIKLLGLSGLHVKKYEDQKRNSLFYLEQRRKSAACSICLQKTTRRHGYSSLRRVKHGTILGKVCTLVFRPRRFFCDSCQRVFTEEITIAKKYQRATQKHKKEVVLNLEDRSFLSGTRKYNVSYHTQRKWLNEIVSSSVFDFSQEEKENTPFVLGIDEVSFSGHKMLTTVGNISKHRLKGVMTSKNKTELKKLFGRKLQP